MPSAVRERVVAHRGAEGALAAFEHRVRLQGGALGCRSRQRGHRGRPRRRARPPSAASAFGIRCPCGLQPRQAASAITPMSRSESWAREAWKLRIAVARDGCGGEAGGRAQEERAAGDGRRPRRSGPGRRRAAGTTRRRGPRCRRAPRAPRGRRPPRPAASARRRRDSRRGRRSRGSRSAAASTGRAPTRATGRPGRRSPGRRSVAPASTAKLPASPPITMFIQVRRLRSDGVDHPVEERAQEDEEGGHGVHRDRRPRRRRAPA